MPAPPYNFLPARSIPLSRIMSHDMKLLAEKFPATKFVSILSTRCIENYPDKNLPSVFIYRNGEMKAQLVGPLFWGDVKNIEGKKKGKRG